ncbi:MAG: amidoligase family protein [Paracoccaceae bacterium]
MDRTFAPLPQTRTEAVLHRKIGVEIEFSGLTEDETANILQKRFGGHVGSHDAHRITLEGTDIGKVKIELDTALRKLSDSRLVDLGLSLSRAVVPVEIVTQPLDGNQLERLDRVCDDLRDAGAHSTADGILLGFGVHLNFEIVAYQAAHTTRTILAFGLLEDWLRSTMQIDRTRRILPFIAPWPRDYVAAIACDRSDLAFDSVRTLYARHVNSRNHGLDLLPIFKAADEQAFEQLFPDQETIKGRPAFHFRLPDSRIDEPAWSLRQEYVNWCRIERFAEDPDRLDQLAKAFLKRNEVSSANREDWAAYCAEQFGAEVAT